MIRKQFYIDAKFVEKEWRTMHVGRTVYVCTESVRVMSDVWEWQTLAYSITDEGRLEPTCLSWEGMKSEEAPEFEIDATEEAFALYHARRREMKLGGLVDEANRNSTDPAFKGRVVKVARGRNGKGTVGKVIAVIERVYSAGYRSALEYKLGIATSDRMIDVRAANGKIYSNHADVVWAWARNCDVVSPELPDLLALNAKATEYADHEVAELRARMENSKKVTVNKIAA